MEDYVYGNDPEESLADSRLDYEADDIYIDHSEPSKELVEPEAVSGAVAAGDVLNSQYYQTLKPEADSAEPQIKSIAQQQEEFANNQAKAEQKIDHDFDLQSGMEQTRKFEVWDERRHEIKDNSFDEKPAVEQVEDQAETALALGEFASQHVQDNPATSGVTQIPDFDSPAAAQSTGLYRQAIIGGFWAGISLAVLILIIFLLS